MTIEERNDAIEFFKKVAEKEVDNAKYSKLAIEALNQESSNDDENEIDFIQPKKKIVCKLTNGDVLLDKLRDEFISLYPKNYLGEPELGGSSCVFSLNKVLNILDKYKAESEG